MLEHYRTILEGATAETVDKKSRFIANVRPVKTEVEAKAFIEEIRKEHWNATHNVFAYQIGERNEIQRFSDDGEPQGTAGMPILTVLTGEDIKNCCIVVTRYFGGTLLGTGGLVRAYGRCAKEGILAAGIAEINTFREFSIPCDYSMQGKIQYHLTQENHIIKDTIFTDKVEFIVLTQENKAEQFQNEITQITSAKVCANSIRSIYGAFVNDELIELET